MRTPSMSPGLLGAACAALALAVPLAAQGRVDPPRLAAELREYAELAEQVEAWYADMEADANAFFAWADSKESLREADAAVGRYLEAHPDDPAALVLRARLLQVLGLHGTALTVQGGQLRPQGQGDLPDRARELLHRAIALVPSGWPEPHYRLARVYLQPRVAEGPEGDALVMDADSALAAARRALDMDPRNRDYRRLAAAASLAAGDTAAALELAPELEKQLRLLVEIRADLDRIPVPPSAAEGRYFLATAGDMLSQGWFRHYAAERVRSWIVPLAVEDVEAFYRERSEGFSLLTDEEAARGAPEEAPRMSMQHLRLERDRLVAARDDRDLKKRYNNRAGGVLVVVGSHSVVPEGLDLEQLPPAFADGLPLTEIVLVSLHREPR